MAQITKPHIRYTSKDYEALLADLIELAQKKLPEWTDHSPSDPGVVMLECFAYLADVMLYYQDRISQECFPHTAVEKRNVKSLLRLIGYEFKGAFPGRTTVRLTLPMKEIAEPTVTLNVEDAMQLFAEGIEGIGRVNFMFHPGIERLYFGSMVPGYNYEFFTFQNRKRSKILSLQEKFGSKDKLYLISPSRLQSARILTPHVDYNLRKSHNATLQEGYQLVIHTSFLEKMDHNTSVIPLLVEHHKERDDQAKKIASQLYLPVIQAEKSTEITHISEGIPQQQFPLKIPVLQGVKKYWIQDEMEVAVASPDSETWVTWERRENFLDSSPGSFHYYVHLSETDEPMLFFGDGINGAIPPLGSQIRIRFLVGLGERGNIAKGLIRMGYLDSLQIGGAKLGEVVLQNVQPAQGGKKPESTKEAIHHAPRQLKTMERAVTKEDYEYLIKSKFPEVEDLIVQRGPIYKILIYVLFDSAIEKDEKAVEQTLKDIQNYLEDFRMLTVFVELRRAAKLPINIKGDIYLKPQATKKEEWYRQIIYERIDQVVKEMTLVEEPIHKSKIFHAIHTVEEVDYVDNLTVEYDQSKIGIPSYIRIVKSPENFKIVYSGN